MWKPGNARVHLVVVGNRIDFAAYESFTSWQAEVDRIFTTLVVPTLVSGRPTRGAVAIDESTAASY
jgi:hypothetical protein